MRLNQRGDALTLAMAAAVFVGVSVMVMTTVISNIGAKGRRIRVVNETEGTALAINQLLNNRDMCANALRMRDGSRAAFPAVVPPNNAALTFPIDGIWVSGGPANFIYCNDSAPAMCNQNPLVPIKEIRFFMTNSTGNNLVTNYLGDQTGRYRMQVGQLRIQFGSNVLGGVLAPKNFPLNVVVDTTAGSQIVSCSGRESMTSLCIQMGGTLNADGTCTNMMGLCGSRPQDLPSACPAVPSASPTACPAPLRWADVWYAKGIDPSLQMQCACQKICTSP